MKKLLKKIKSAFVEGFTMAAILLDESRRINEDGSWDKYNERQNRKKGGDRK